MINISTLARNEIINNLKIKGIPEGYFLRVGIKGGTCGANYLLGFDKMTEFDEIHEIEGLKILIDKRHLMYVVGVTLDFEEQGNGFTFVK